MLRGDRDEMINCIINECSKQNYMTRLQGDREGDPLGIMHEIEIWIYSKMEYAQTGICPTIWHP